MHVKRYLAGIDRAMRHPGRDEHDITRCYLMHGTIEVVGTRALHNDHDFVDVVAM